MAILFGGAATAQETFPPELLNFTNHPENPVFKSDPGHWDGQIRERGWVMFDAGQYHLWYTGGTHYHAEQHLGYATSPDGIHWTRHGENPVYDSAHVEDMCVVKHDGKYYMFAEAGDFQAPGEPKEKEKIRLLTSTDRVHWTDHGYIVDILREDGQKWANSTGTPSVIVHDGTWYLFFEKADQFIMLAKTQDPLSMQWRLVSDSPVIVRGPEGSANHGAVTVQDVFRYQGKFYLYGSQASDPEWKKWSNYIAVSSDLVEWTIYEKSLFDYPYGFSLSRVEGGPDGPLYFSAHTKVNLLHPAAPVGVEDNSP